MLKLYTDITLLNEANRSRVFPLLFDLHYLDNNYLKEFYSLVQKPEMADIIILPLDYGYMLKYNNSDISRFFEKAKKLNKIIWIYSGGDFGNSMIDEGIYNFRLGGFKSKLNDKTIILPSFISDPYKTCLKKSFKPLKKELVPSIGFVGHAKTGLLKVIKEYISYLRINFKRFLKIEYADYQSFYPSSIKRAKYLQLLKFTKGLKSQFILRNKYRAGVSEVENKEQSTREFYDNIYQNPYTFCMRGIGNFSVRFYETLAVGRIPVLLNTDCLLPLDKIINWEKHCVILDESEYKSLGNMIVNFHNDLSNQAFIEIQKNNRKLWEDFLTRHNFFKTIHDRFIVKLNSNDS